MEKEVRERVRRRARDRCEYCGLPQQHVPLAAFHVEHVTAKQHGGSDDEDNLCLACDHCNYHKGPNLSGIDPESGKVVLLFHPRRQKWDRHFRWNGARLVGLTRAGRATIAVLAINAAEPVALRETLLAEGVFPPRRAD